MVALSQLAAGAAGAEQSGAWRQPAGPVSAGCRRRRTTPMRASGAGHAGRVVAGGGGCSSGQRRTGGACGERRRWRGTSGSVVRGRGPARRAGASRQCRAGRALGRCGAPARHVPVYEAAHRLPATAPVLHKRLTRVALRREVPVRHARIASLYGARDGGIAGAGGADGRAGAAGARPGLGNAAAAAADER